MSSNANSILDLSAEEALFGPSSLELPLDGLVATLCTDERPLQGLAGILDWHFHGAISVYLRAGAMSGAPGEIAYLPMFPKDRLYHILLVGAGESSGPGIRSRLSEDLLSRLRENIRSLKIPRLGLSRSDMGNVPADILAKHFKEVPAWIVF